MKQQILYSPLLEIPNKEVFSFFRTQYNFHWNIIFGLLQFILISILWRCQMEYQTIICFCSIMHASILKFVIPNNRTLNTLKLIKYWKDVKKKCITTINFELYFFKGKYNGI